LIDYIIVGYGIAGLTFASQLIKKKKDFIIIDLPGTNSTYQSGAVLNPTILKRYTLSWKGTEFMKYAKEFYSEFEKKYNVKIFENFPIHRYFSTEQEQGFWIEASHFKSLENYLEKEINKNCGDKILLKNGYGKLKNTAKLDPKVTLETFKLKLDKDKFINDNFNHGKLKIYKNYVKYDNIISKQIVFCEGIQMKNNIFFNYLPLSALKGEVLIIKAPKLSNKYIIKSSIYIIPIYNEVFWVGSTFYKNDDLSINKTREGYEFLISKLNRLISVSYKVLEHNVGLRPAIIDRRPLLGKHPVYKNLILFNGLGTRGIMMAPLLSKWLFDYVSYSKKLPAESSLNRFDSVYRSSVGI